MERARSLLDLDRVLSRTEVFGASPPGVFVGSWGYPRVLAGPLVPPFSDEDTAIMDTPELWLNKTFEDLLRFRFSLIRGKALVPVYSASTPTRLLSVIQELVMASAPVDTEMRLKHKPVFRALMSPREAPLGPSASIERAVLAQNPSVPRTVEKVVYDADLDALSGVKKLYSAGIPQRQITRMFSVGLLGKEPTRRLVPTEWSITAIDDILGKTLRRKVLTYPWINDYRVFGWKALANNVQVLLMPSAWMFEALEAWLVSPGAQPCADFELTKGRKAYPSNIAGAYHASRLPILEYLERTRRQAAGVAFLEVSRNWIPLGVWRFRELCRKALGEPGPQFTTLDEALSEIGRRLELPLERWITASGLISYHKAQTSLLTFTLA